MSVPVGLRGENLSTCFVDASDILALVIRTTANSKHYPHKLTRELGEQAVHQARRVMHAVYSANAEVSDASRRRLLCMEAFEAMDCLQAEIHLAYIHFNLKAWKGGEMLDMISGLRTKFKAWQRAHAESIG